MRWAGLLAVILPAAPLFAGEATPLRFTPIAMESALIQPFHHGLETRLDLAMDAFTIKAGTESLNGLFTRAQPSIDYRYAPAKNAEFLFHLPYTAQGEDRTDSNGKKVSSRYSAGASAPTVGFKILLGEKTALALRTRPPTAAPRDPRLGDGTHYAGDILFKNGMFNLSVGHTVRLPYVVQTSTETHRRDPGDVDELAVALTSRDRPAFAQRDFVGPVMELHLLYADSDRLDGRGVSGSASLTGKAVLGFVLGKIDLDAVHLTTFAVSAGVGSLLHKTQDPVFGVGALQMTIGYGLLWGGYE